MRCEESFSITERLVLDAAGMMGDTEPGACTTKFCLLMLRDIVASALKYDDQGRVVPVFNRSVYVNFY